MSNIATFLYSQKRTTLLAQHALGKQKPKDNFAITSGFGKLLNDFKNLDKTIYHLSVMNSIPLIDPHNVIYLINYTMLPMNSIPLIVKEKL